MFGNINVQVGNSRLGCRWLAQRALLERGFDLGDAGNNAGFVLFTAGGT
jgi:hypothetical protein